MSTAASHIKPYSSTPKAYDLGSIQNKFGILSDDRKKIRTAAWRSATHLGATESARSLSLSRQSAYKEEVTVSEKLLRNITAVVFATDLAAELLGGDLEETGKWLMSPNSIFSGDSPFLVCMRGDGSAVLEWLNTRLGRVPGAAF